MRRFKCFTLSILALTAISCINQDYDLEQINLDVFAGLKGITLPIGSTEKFYLDDYLNDDMTAGLLKSDAQGNYYFSFSGQASADGLAIPDFAFDGYRSDSHTRISETAIVINNIDQYRDYVSEVIEFKDFIYPIEIFQSNLPKEIIDITYADVKTEMVVDFSFDPLQLPFECIWIASGTKITYPECLIPGELPDGLRMIGSNVLELSEDFPINASGSSITIPIDAFDLTLLPENQGILSPGTIFIDQVAVISGGFYFRVADCLDEGVFYPGFDSSLSIGTMEVQSVTAALEIDGSSLSVKQQLEVTDIPEFLNNEDFKLDFNKLRLNLALIDDSPFSGSINAAIATGTNSETFWTADIPGLSFASYATSRFSLSEEGTGAAEGYEDKAVPGLNSIMSRIPEIISLESSLDINEDYLEIVPGSSYSFGVEYDFDIPMSFGDKLSICLTEDITDMNVVVEGVMAPKAVVSLNFVNAIPLGLELQAIALDDDGQELTHIRAEINQSVQPGTADSPVVTPIEINLTCGDKLAFDGLRLHISLSSASEGAVLNSNQYIQITDISLYLPDGIGYSK